MDSSKEKVEELDLIPIYLVKTYDKLNPFVWCIFKGAFFRLDNGKNANSGEYVDVKKEERNSIQIDVDNNLRNDTEARVAMSAKVSVLKPISEESLFAEWIEVKKDQPNQYITAGQKLKVFSDGIGGLTLKTPKNMNLNIVLPKKDEFIKKSNSDIPIFLVDIGADEQIWCDKEYNPKKELVFTPFDKHYPAVPYDGDIIVGKEYISFAAYQELCLKKPEDA